MSTVYLRQGSTIHPTSSKNLETSETLDVATYSVAFDNQKGTFYLSEIHGMTNVGDVYGDVNERISRIMNTFKAREKSTGVLLCGAKGTGKSFLAKELAKTALTKGMPVVLVSENYRGPTFNAFIDSLEQDIMVLFDEFDKTYSYDMSGEQEALLTLLDGTNVTRKLYVFTCNNIDRIDKHMLNRPGRIFYRFNYNTLDQEIVKAYCEDKLLHQQHADEIMRLSSMSSKFNFDGLVAMVDEINRYTESPSEVLRILNIELTPDKGLYDITLLSGYDKKKYTRGEIEGRANVHINPSRQFQLNLYDERDGLASIMFDPSDMIKQTAGVLEYKNKQGASLILTLRKSFDTGGRATGGLSQPTV